MMGIDGRAVRDTEARDRAGADPATGTASQPHTARATATATARPQGPPLMALTEFILALSKTDIGRRINRHMLQLSVIMCPHCGALVAEDQMPLHEEFHRRTT